MNRWFARLRAAVTVAVVLAAGQTAMTPAQSFPASGAALAVPALVGRSPGVTRVFVRQTSTGVRIGAYLATGGAPRTYLQGELSLGPAAGILGADASKAVPSRSLRALAATVFGTNGKDATGVIVRTGSDVAIVRANFSGGATDGMRPVDGWAILAQLGSGLHATVAGYDAHGHRLASVPMPKPTHLGEGSPGESVATFVRITNQGVLIIGHTLPANGSGWIYPYLADRGAVQPGLEGVPVCRPTQHTDLAADVVIIGVDEGVPLTQPMTVVIVHGGAAIARVKVVFTGGAEDGMNTVAGQAVLVTLGTVPNNGRLDMLQRATIQGFNVSGKLITTTLLSPLGAGRC